MAGFRIFKLDDGSFQLECNEQECENRIRITAGLDDMSASQIYGDMLAEYQGKDCGCNEPWCLICHPKANASEVPTEEATS